MKLTVKLPNFTLTRGKIPGAGGGGVLRAFRRNFRKYLLWGGAGLFFFVFFAWLSLPTRAIAWRIGHEAKSRGYIIDIEDVSISLFGGVTLENVRWTFEPSRPGQVPIPFELEEVDVDVGLFALLIGNLDVELETELDEGMVSAHYYHGGDESQVQVEINDVPLYGLPKLAQSLNAPLRGILAIKVDLTMPEHKFEDAQGSIELTCAACMVGDGEEKLFIPDSKALQGGVVIPEIDMGTLSGRLSVEDGMATTDGPIETNSDDVWIQITGSIDFSDPFTKSRIDMVLKFNLGERLQDESEPMRFMIQTAKPSTKLDAPEKGLGFRLEGPVAKPRFIGIKSKSRRQSRLDKRAQQRERDERRRQRRPSKPTTSATRSRGTDDDKDKPGPSVRDEPIEIQPIERGRDAASPTVPAVNPRDAAVERPSANDRSDDRADDDQPSEENDGGEPPDEGEIPEGGEAADPLDSTPTAVEDDEQERGDNANDEDGSPGEDADERAAPDEPAQDDGRPNNDGE